MRGYVYLDAGRTLQIKNEEYIDVHDPGFFERNRHLVLLRWKFDTQNEGMMYELMSSFKRKQIPVSIVKEFCLQAGFDLSAFLTKYKKESLVFEQPKENKDWQISDPAIKAKE